jgi:copper chaperone CopZ
MKKSMIYKMLLIAVVSIFVLSQSAFAEIKELKIKTSAKEACCKEKIETGMNKIDGVSNVKLNLKSKTVTLKYDTDKAQAENICKTLADMGFNASVKSMKIDIKAAKPFDCSVECKDKAKGTDTKACCKDKKDCKDKKACSKDKKDCKNMKDDKKTDDGNK